MYYSPYMYPYPYYANAPMYDYGTQPSYWNYPNGFENANRWNPFHSTLGEDREMLTDYGPNPYVVNIYEATRQNNTFRTALWTGEHLQVTLMSLGVGEDVGLEMHPGVDQFLRIEQGQGIVQMGKDKNNLDFQMHVYDDSAIMIPAGAWHNLTNTGHIPLKLYSIYAPPNHPFGTVHPTKADAAASEEKNHHRNR